MVRMTTMPKDEVVGRVFRAIFKWLGQLCTAYTWTSFYEKSKLTGFLKDSM